MRATGAGCASSQQPKACVAGATRSRSNDSSPPAATFSPVTRKTNYASSKNFMDRSVTLSERHTQQVRRLGQPDPMEAES